MQLFIEGQLLIRYRHGCRKQLDETILSHIMATMNVQAGAPTEPDPSRWLTETRRSEIIAHLASSRRLLQQGGLWRATLGYWARWQAFRCRMEERG